MPRKERVEFEGAIYHVMDRGNRGEAIFRSDEDRVLFLKTLGEACAKTGWKIHSYVLMGNHYHLLLETPEANLCTGMKWFQGTYTARHNARHKLKGHLFQGRYKAILVDGEEGLYFRTLSDYIHLNPIRAGIIPPGESLESYHWSSYPALLESENKRPPWLCGAWVLGGYGGSDSSEGRKAYQKAMEQRAQEERSGGSVEEGLLKQLRRGWVFGSDAFRHKLLTMMDSGIALKGAGGVIQRSHDEQEAQRLLTAGLAEFQLAREELCNHPKGSVLKIAIAVLIKKSTVMTNGWIARELRMGDPSRVSRYCSEAEGRSEVQELVRKLDMFKSMDCPLWPEALNTFQKNECKY